MTGHKLWAAMLGAICIMTAPAMAVAAQETETQEDAATIQIGTKATETDYVVAVTNETGKDITAVAIKVDDADFGENLLSDGVVWTAQAEGTLYCTPAEIKEGQTKAPRYDIALTFADGKEAVLHTFPFGDADSVRILLDELSGDDLDEESEEVIEIAYLRFTSKSLGTEQDTQWHEWDVVAPGKAEEAAAAYAAKQAAAAAAAQSYWSDDAGSSYSYSAPSGNGGGNGGGGNGGGNDAQCLTGGLLN